MERLYQDAADKNVAATFVYCRGGDQDAEAYSDAECTKRMTISEMREAFQKGCLIVSGQDIFHKPYAFMGGTDKAWLYYIHLMDNTEFKRSSLIAIPDPIEE